ncbi:Ldh family oxidoreductase [Muricoccus pecuniae]|uniref:LDH2 family malate/lactate/ureidoglycolate dehydrogenase n=1 Tax=Muricoccus pecuniae TaxID=693023 RepID=A0A840Y0Q8_9PROT|nr:Ldh family oxidoreductase [Roseomonas pecuniae]MBB5694698.1 LDH2 family malate/lactate/ureidoglycolate dehydrogenase [Roseomonas pecuniae]
MTDAVIAEDALLLLATRALVAGGMSAEDARPVARVLVLADLFGLRTHGVSRVAQYLGRVRVGGIDPRAAVRATRVAPGLSMVDGANGIGPLVGVRTLEAAMESAREVGIGAAFARASNHFGPIMPYSLIAAERGFASIIGTNATTTIAPWGGRDTRLGNNPLGIGVPVLGGQPVILDLAMSVAARAKIRRALKDGTALPEGWAADADGRPTTDPAAALAGFLLPFGGHKGYGLALMVDLLSGLLSGAAYLTHVRAWDKEPEARQDLGHFFILIDTKRLAEPGALAARMEDFRHIIRSTPAADPARPVRLPGDAEFEEMARQRRDGVSVAAEDLAAMEALAGPAPA